MSNELTNNIFYTGVVEDRDDPLHIGRVRVRVLGVHSQDKGDIPTDKLPWASVVLPTTSATNSGIGHSPVGMLPGTWVLVFFADGNYKQNPVVLGTLPGFHSNEAPNKQESVVDAAAKENSTGEAEKTIPMEDVKSYDGTDAVADYGKGKLFGSVVRICEVGRDTHDAGIIKTKGRTARDPCGHGPYQLSGANAATLREYVARSKFGDLKRFDPVRGGNGTYNPNFDAMWKKVAQEHGEEFFKEQHNYVVQTHYTNVVRNLGSWNLSKRSDAIKEYILAFSVNMGPGGGRSVCNRATKGKDVTNMTDADLVELLYKARLERSPNWAKTTRAPQEYRLVKAMLKQNPTPAGNEPLEKADETKKEEVLNDKGEMETIEVPEQPTLKEKNSPPQYLTGSGEQGFADPNGTYPQNGYLSKPSTNKLAIGGDSRGTIADKKKQELINAGNDFEEPNSYAPKYPYNKVIETECGHVIELDSTPDAERIHIYHKSGTFIEMHPDGKIVFKTQDDSLDFTIGDKKIFVNGDTQIICQGDLKATVQGKVEVTAGDNIDLMTEGDINLLANNDINIMAGNECNINADSKIMEMSPLIERLNASKNDSTPVNVGDLIEIKKATMEPETPGPEEGWTDSYIDSGGNQTASYPEGAPSQDIPNYEKGYESETTGTIETTGDNVKIEKVSPPGVDRSLVDNANGNYSANLKISKHFTLGQMQNWKRIYSNKQGLSPKQCVYNLQLLAVNILDPIVDKLGKTGWIITNTIRNRGGKSHHELGLAVDIQGQGWTMTTTHHLKFAEQLRQLLPAWGQLAIEYGASKIGKPLIHVSYVGQGAFFGKSGTGMKSNSNFFCTWYNDAYNCQGNNGTRFAFCTKSRQKVYPK